MMKSFHNTINEKDNLSLFETQATKQESIILDWFKRNPEEYATPFDIWDRIFGEDTPVTSVRRAMSNLSKKGLLFKTSTQKVERYGKRNYCWKLNKG